MMPAVTFNLFDQYRKNNFNGGAVDIDLATLKIAIVTGAYTVDQNLHDFFNDVVANEVSGTGYTAGGNACTVGTVTVNGAGLVTVDCNDPATWAQDGAGFSNGRRAILYDSGPGSDATRPLVGFSNDFGADQGNVAGDFTVTINAAGIFTAARG